MGTKPWTIAMAVSCRATVPVAVQFLRQTMRLPYNFSGSSRSIRVYSWHLPLLFSVNRIKPVRQKELFLRRQKRFRGSNDRAQSCRHLKTDQDKDDAPDSEMTFAPRARKKMTPKILRCPCPRAPKNRPVASIRRKPKRMPITQKSK